MARNLKSTIDLEHVATELESARIEENGRVSYSSLRFHDLVSIVAAACLREELGEEALLAIARDGIFNAGAKGQVTAKRLRSSVAQALARYTKQAVKKYVLATSISLQWTSQMRSVRLPGAVVTFTPNLPSWFDRSNVHESRQKPPALEGKRFVTARICVKARNPGEAWQRASSAFDFLRGVWNFSLNKGKWSERFVDSTKPVNQIILGPISTLHYPNGKSATDAFWYDPFFAQPRNLSIPHSRWDKVRGDEVHIRSVVKKWASGATINGAFIRYCRALDSREPQTAFLQLWSLLETLTDTGNDRYDTTIRRLCYLYNQPKTEGYLLEILRLRRNRSVHFGDENSTRLWRQWLIELHRYVSQLMIFILQSTRFFGNLKELGDFLSLPADQELLERGAKLREEALYYKGYKKSELRKKA